MEWAFLGIVAGGVGILWKIYDSLNQLNVKIAVVITRMDSHEDRISKLESRK
jgi:hypothetical protein